MPRTRVSRPGVVAAAILLVLTGCGGDSPVRDLGTQAVVIGIDGADWRVIEPLAEAGGMANLMSLRERGTWGPIDTLPDIPLSPVIWTSVATGKTPAKHGVAWFMVDQPDGTRAPIRSYNRKTKAIWNILAEHRRRPTVLGWWATYPAESVGKGAIVSDALGFHGFGATAREGDDGKKTYPASLYGQLNNLIPPEQQVSAEFVQRFIHLSAEDYRKEMFDPGRFPRRNPFNPIHLFQEYAVTAQGYAAISEHLLQERPFDLFMVYFEQVDSFSHLFMKFAPPKLEWIEEDPYERYKDVVNEWYLYQDELLGRLLAAIDLKTTAVFILSDHGFKSGERRIRSEQAVDVKKAHLDHERDGILLATGPHLRSGSRIEGASVLDITPTLLHYLGFPVAKDMDGKVLETLFEPEFMEENPIRYLATFEDGNVDPNQAPAAQPDRPDFDQEQLAETEDALRALGYLDSEGDSAGDPAAMGAEGETSPEIHNNMGRIHLRNGDPDKAMREFEQALQLDPANADALLNIGEIHRFQGRVVQAEHFVERALQVNPNSIGALAQLAELRRDTGDLSEAIRLFEEALAIDDSLPFLFLGYGDVLQRAGRLDEAERAFISVLELDPDSFKARYNLGVTYANRGETAKAIETYQDALEASPEDPEAAKAWNNLGAIHLDRGETEEAQKAFESAVARSPYHFESRYNLALIYLSSERAEDAVKLLEEAAAIQPNHEVITTRLAMTYLGLGRHEDAYRGFLLVRRLYPRNWVAALGLAVLYAASEQPEEAKQQLQAALEIGGEPALEEARAYPVLAPLLQR